MKPVYLILSLFLLGSNLKAQTSDFFQEVKNLLNVSHPDLDLNEKLIAINLWSVNDKNSREHNKAFEKVCSTYAYSKLQGGRKGVVVLLFNKENLDEFSIITMGKDGVKCSLSFKVSDLKNAAQLPSKNIVFNAGGEVVYTNLSSELIFSSFQSLITR